MSYESMRNLSMSLEDDNRELRDTNRALLEQLDEARRHKKAAEAERDTFAAENDAIHRAVNEMCGTDTSTIEAVQHVIEQRDDLRRQLEQARNREQMDRDVMTEASRMIDELRQEARDSAGRVVTLMAELEQAQRRIEELETTLKDIATAPYENQPNDGDEWEKEYYLRGMHRT